MLFTILSNHWIWIIVWNYRYLRCKCSILVSNIGMLLLQCMRSAERKGERERAMAYVEWYTTQVKQTKREKDGNRELGRSIDNGSLRKRLFLSIEITRISTGKLNEGFHMLFYIIEQRARVKVKFSVISLNSFQSIRWICY